MSLPQLDVPASCADCPAICDIESRLVANQVRKKANEVVATDIVMSEPPKEIVDLVTKHTGASTENIREVLGMFQEILSTQIEDAYVEVEKDDNEALSAVKALTDNCEGRLKMRGQTKLGVTVTTTVCGSLLAPIDPTIPEHAHVDREK